MSYTAEIKTDNFNRLWFVLKDEKEKPGKKIIIDIQSMFLHLRNQYSPESLRRPRLIIKQGPYHNVDGFEYTKGLFFNFGNSKKCHRIKENNRVQLKTSKDTIEDIRQEIYIQRGLASISNLFCPIIYAYMKVSRKEGFKRCAVLIAKGYDRSILHLALPPLALHKVFIAIAKAINDAHFNNVVISDLKDDNILYSDGGKIAITDLGGAFKINRPPESNCSTLVYASPESLTGTFTKMHDIFTFGIVIFLKAIRFQFPMSKIKDLKKLLSPEDFKLKYILELLEFRKKIPESSPYRSLICDMLRPNPQCRPNIETVIKRLEELTPLLARAEAALQKSRNHICKSNKEDESNCNKTPLFNRNLFLILPIEHQ